MADVTVKYKDSAIASLNSSGAKTLNTSGKYCEGDIKVEYAPRSKSYDITLSKASGWILLTTLESEVLSHINDDTLMVTLIKADEKTSDTYACTGAFVTNHIIGTAGNYPVYGIANRQNNATTLSAQPIFYKANDTSTSTSLGGHGHFRISGSSYYFQPSDGFIQSGSYRLTFTW